MFKKLLITLFICTLSINFAYAEQNEDKDLKNLVDTLTNALNSRDFRILYNEYYTESGKRRIKERIKETQKSIEIAKTDKEIYERSKEVFEQAATAKIIPHYTLNDVLKLKKEKDIYNYYMNTTSIYKIFEKDYKELKSIKYIFMGAESYDEDEKQLTYTLEAETDKGLITELYKLDIKKEKGKWLIDDDSNVFF